MVIKIRNASHLRTNNIRVMLKEFLKHQPISRSELARKLRVSPSTISQILKPFMERRIIVETMPGTSTGGRPPLLLSMNPESVYVLAIDLSSYQSRIALVNPVLEIVLSEQIELDHNIIPGLEKISNVILKLFEKIKIDETSLLGVCIGISGVLDPKTGRLSSGLIKDIENVRLAEFFKKRIPFHKNIYIENDANLAALGEFMNIEDEVDNMIYIHLGDGLGGAIVANKNIFHGDRGYAGEIGKMVYCMKPLTTVGDVYENIRCNMNQESLVEFENLLFCLIQDIISLTDISQVIIGGNTDPLTDEMIMRLEKRVREFLYGFDVCIRKSKSHRNSLLTGAAQYLLEREIPKL